MYTPFSCTPLFGVHYASSEYPVAKAEVTPTGTLIVGHVGGKIINGSRAPPPTGQQRLLVLAQRFRDPGRLLQCVYTGTSRAAGRRSTLAAFLWA